MHDCGFCRRHRAVNELLPRLPTDEDRKLVSDLHNILSHLEEDHSYDNILLSAYREKYGPLGFSEAVKIVEDVRLARKV